MSPGTCEQPSNSYSSLIFHRERTVCDDVKLIWLFIDCVLCFCYHCITLWTCIYHVSCIAYHIFLKIHDAFDRLSITVVLDLVVTVVPLEIYFSVTDHKMFPK